MSYSPLLNEVVVDLESQQKFVEGGMTANNNHSNTSTGNPANVLENQESMLQEYRTLGCNINHHDMNLNSNNSPSTDSYVQYTSFFFEYPTDDFVCTTTDNSSVMTSGVTATAAATKANKTITPHQNNSNNSFIPNLVPPFVPGMGYLDEYGIPVPPPFLGGPDHAALGFSLPIGPIPHNPEHRYPVYPPPPALHTPLNSFMAKQPSGQNFNSQNSPKKQREGNKKSRNNKSGSSTSTNNGTSNMNGSINSHSSNSYVVPIAPKTGAHALNSVCLPINDILNSTETNDSNENNVAISSKTIDKPSNKDNRHGKSNATPMNHQTSDSTLVPEEDATTRALLEQDQETFFKTCKEMRTRMAPNQSFSNEQYIKSSLTHSQDKLNEDTRREKEGSEFSILNIDDRSKLESNLIQNEYSIEDGFHSKSGSVMLMINNDDMGDQSASFVATDRLGGPIFPRQDTLYPYAPPQHHVMPSHEIAKSSGKNKSAMVLGNNISPYPKQDRVKSTIPRPSNSFILYRRSKHVEIMKSYKGDKALNNNFISKIVAKWWKAEPAEVKAYWSKMAEEEKRAHAEKYPDYKYRPKKSGQKGNNNVNGNNTCNVNKSNVQFLNKVNNQIGGPHDAFGISPSHIHATLLHGEPLGSPWAMNIPASALTTQQHNLMPHLNDPLNHSNFARPFLPPDLHIPPYHDMNTNSPIRTNNPYLPSPDSPPFLTDESSLYRDHDFHNPDTISRALKSEVYMNGNNPVLRQQSYHDWPTDLSL